MKIARAIYRWGAEHQIDHSPGATIECQPSLRDCALIRRTAPSDESLSLLSIAPDGANNLRRTEHLHIASLATGRASGCQSNEK